MEAKKKPRQRRGFFLLLFYHQVPQLLPHDPQEEPPPSGMLEEMANPDRGPASMKSTLMVPQVFSKLDSTRNFKLS